MRSEDLCRHYPKLYHIAWGGSWPSIREHGLLSTRSLLKLYGKSDSEIAKLTQARRGHWEEIHCAGRPKAVLRDQKPMTDKGLRKALPASVEPRRWYELINSMVFFWPTIKRLETMLTAAAYQEVEHDVLVVETKALLQFKEAEIRLSRMNSGCTRPMPHPRDMDLFKRIDDYPFPNRPSPSVVKKAIAEVCVIDRVERMAEVVIKVESGSACIILEAINND